MNQSLQGWKLALALLLAAAVIGGAGYIAYGALSDDGQDVELVDDDSTAASTPTATALPVTDPVTEPTTGAPTALPLPSAVPAPSPAPVATATTTAPAATAAPAPTQTAAPAPSQPVPTATPVPSSATLSCAGSMPTTMQLKDTLGPLTATTVPAAAAAGFQFLWNFGDNTTASAPTTGAIGYTAVGTYTVTVTGTNAATGETINATCGTVTVTETDATLTVRCRVSVVNTAVSLVDARAPEEMRVALTWTPADVKLNLQYEFETLDPIVFSNDASSGDSRTNSFTTDAGVFTVFWRNAETGATGRVSCPAYPREAAPDDGTPTPTPTVDIFASPTPAPSATVDGDTDGDGVVNSADAFPTDPNESRDFDADGIGDNADPDDDNDGVLDGQDWFPNNAAENKDTDQDGVGDNGDNCPVAKNADQADTDGDGVGDVCDLT